MLAEGRNAMSDVRPRLMPIGRFSEVSGLSVKALRNYDELGLLEPAYVDDNTGYRYYTLGQSNRAEAIRLLRTVDLPLAEIRAVLDERDRAAVAVRLELHRGRLEQRLTDVQRTLGFLQDLIESKEGVMPYEVSLKETPAQTVLAITTPVDMTAVGAVFGPALGEICGSIAAGGLGFAGPPFTVYSEFDEEGQTATLQICVPVERAPEAPPTGRLELVDLPACTLAWTVHRGPYREVRPAYSALYGWMEERGHSPAGPPRETYLNDPGEVAESDLLTEVAWPVAR
jgi:effector-binding domain-containing protein/DNA-binding transcriptional MerR regulator